MRCLLFVARCLLLLFVVGAWCLSFVVECLNVVVVCFWLFVTVVGCCYGMVFFFVEGCWFCLLFTDCCCVLVGVVRRQCSLFDVVC